MDEEEVMTRQNLIDDLVKLAAQQARLGDESNAVDQGHWARDVERKIRSGRSGRIGLAIETLGDPEAPQRLRDDERWSAAIPRLLGSGSRADNIEAWRLALVLRCACEREELEARHTRLHWAGLLLIATQIEAISGDALRLLAVGIGDERVSAGLLRLADRVDAEGVTP